MAKLFSIWDVRESVFTISSVFFFENPKDGQNNCVVEWFRKIPVVLEKDPKGKVTKWGDPRIIPIKVFCTLPHGTSANDIEYVESSMIRPKSN